MHVIGKYIFDLRASRADGLLLQKELQETIEQKLIPRMERLFDGIAKEDVSIAIDKIDVEIDVTEDNDWLDKLLDKVLEKMQTNIQFHINLTRAELDDHKKEAPERLSASGLFKSKALMTIEKFTFFLKYGYLPWWCAGEEFNLKEQSIMEVIQLPGMSTNDIEFLKQELRATLSSEKSIERLLQQFSGNLFYTLIRFIVPDESLSIVETIEEYELFEQEKKLPELYGRKRMDEFKKDLLLTAIKRHSDINWKKFIEGHSIKELNRKYSQTPGVAVEGIHDNASNEQSEREQLLNQQNEGGQDPDQLPEKKNEKDQAREQLLNQQEEKEQRQQQEPGRKKEKDRAALIRKLFSDQDGDPDEEVFIANAGLVIAAPFLPRLFENLGWLRNGELLSPTSAIYLLHYLGSGNLIGMEYEFGLNKILCGVDIHEPLSPVEALRPNELEEANKVLMAILEHWKVLKNTSMEGLRETFLLRNGKLSRTDDRWLLQVEQKSYDMLLQSLPWSINIIQLPFMKTSLQVEWN